MIKNNIMYPGKLIIVRNPRQRSEYKFQWKYSGDMNKVRAAECKNNFSIGLRLLEYMMYRKKGFTMFSIDHPIKCPATL